MNGLALFLCMTAGVCWAGSGVAAQHFFQHSPLSAMDLTVFRMLSTCAIMTIVTCAKGQWRRNWQVMKARPMLWGQFLFYGVVALMAMHYSYFEAIRLGNAAVVTVIQYTCPAIVICWVSFSQRKLPGRGPALAVVLAVLGTFLLVTGGRLDALSVPADCLAWAVFSAFTYATASVFPKHLSGSIDNSFLLAWGMLFGAIPSWLFVPDLNFLDFFHADLLIDLFVIVILGTAVAFICYNAGLSRMSADQASITTTIEPVASVVMSYLLFGTVFSAVQAGGIAMIIAAIAMPAVLGRKKRAQAGRLDEGV